MKIEVLGQEQIVHGNQNVLIFEALAISIDWSVPQNSESVIL